MNKFKNEHGKPNNIILQEEHSLLNSVDKILNSTSNSQVIGRNGELLLLSFLNRYLPNTLRAVTGHFITPSGKLSPQLDIMILDSRYPLLSENEDGSVLAMLHSLITTIEVKTNLTSKDIKKSWNDSRIIMELSKEILEYGDINSFSSIKTQLVAYKCKNHINTVNKHFMENAQPLKSNLDISILRILNSDDGVLLHFEPINDFENESIDGYLPLCIPQYTPLSDFYYSLIQNSYYTLGNRDFDFNIIGEHFMDYMSWTTIKE